VLRSSRYPDGLPVGQAAATTAGDLPARWVIHTVGPVYSTRADRSAQLASCYERSLVVADELGAATVAFPAVSAGAFGWPPQDAARVALTAVSRVACRVEEVRFVLFSADMHEVFGRALAALPGAGQGQGPDAGQGPGGPG
jgi:O-acetyl-ADP-ribose deacetylase (regulator of RNase III)